MSNQPQKYHFHIPENFANLEVIWSLQLSLAIFAEQQLIMLGSQVIAINQFFYEISTKNLKSFGVPL